MGTIAQATDARSSVYRRTVRTGRDGFLCVTDYVLKGVVKRVEKELEHVTMTTRRSPASWMR